MNDTAENPPSELEGRIVAALRTIYDPEVPVNIYDMGLIYGVDIEEGGRVNIRMTLTTPACPVATILPGQVEAKVKTVPEVSAVKVDVVWDPPWTPDMMSDAAKLQLNMDLDTPKKSSDDPRYYNVKPPGE